MLHTNQEVQSSTRAARSAPGMPEQLSAAQSAQVVEAAALAAQQTSSAQLRSGASRVPRSSAPRLCRGGQDGARGGHRSSRHSMRLQRLGSGLPETQSAVHPGHRVDGAGGHIRHGHLGGGRGAARWRGRHQNHICPLWPPLAGGHERGLRSVRRLSLAARAATRSQQG